MLQNLLFVMSE